MSTDTAPTPATLAEVHELLARKRPALDAGPRRWAAFHRRSAEMYVDVAKVDVGHQHEALNCAGAEVRQARAIEDSLTDVSAVEAPSDDE